MPIFTHVPREPNATHIIANEALTRLSQLSESLAVELQRMPDASKELLDAMAAEGTSQLQEQIASLIQDIDAFWAAPDARGQIRRELLLSSMPQALRDELTLKIHERDLEPEYAACLPSAFSPTPQQTPAGTAPTSFSLHVQFSEDNLVEINGALVMSIGQGGTLLALPGIGLQGFSTQTALCETLVIWLNDKALQHALLNNAEQRYQDIAIQIAQDPDLFLEPFELADVQLKPITGDPFQHALSRQFHKQRQDVRYACGEGRNVDPTKRSAQLREAIRMSGLFGPTAMLELRELAYLESRQRQQLPDWIKIADTHELKLHVQHLRDYDIARAVLISAMGGTASPEQFAAVRLRASIANDLGYDLNPEELSISTRRTLALTGETYTVRRSLVQLSLYGLHPGDRDDGSQFLTQTTLSLNGEQTATGFALLTPAYIARLVDELNLRAIFGECQRKAYESEQTQQLMRDLTRRQVTALGHTAKMQGHIQPADFEILEAIAGTRNMGSDAVLRVQQVKLNNLDVLSKLLVFRKENQIGQLDRLILLASDAPREQRFKAFNNETQLLHELVAWSASTEMSEYLLAQVELSSRPTLERQLANFRQKPYPEDNYVQLITLPDYDAALLAFVRTQAQVALSEQTRHTPDWFLRASLSQRQELLALEDAAQGAAKKYEAKTHTHVQPFEAYVHKRASQQISKLLGVPVGTVDPDQIVITSERETLTYTQMLLNGYDDSINFIKTSADTQATFSGPQGVDLRLLTPATVAGSVRGKWLADDYIKLIRSTLLDEHSTGYDYRRKTSLLIAQLQMKAAALRSLLKGQIEAHQYQWLKASIDNVHLNDTRTRDRYPLYPLQIHVDKPFIGSGLRGPDQLVISSPALTHIETVQGCYVILPTEIRQSALLYTPLAPDGVEFRLFGDFTDSLKGEGMIDYYKDRCRIKARKTLSFFLHDMKNGRANKPPAIPKDSFSDFHEICFNRPIERTLRDVEETTTGRHDMLARLIWNSVQLIATVVTLPFPPASFAVGALLSFHDSMRALQALADSDQETAGAYILSSILNGAGAAGDLSSGLKGFGGLLHRLERKVGRSSVLKPIPLTPEVPSQASLRPVTLEGEPFWVGKPDINRHAEILRINTFSPHELETTGQFARPDASGQWHPVGYQANQTTPILENGVRREWIVNLPLNDVPQISNGHAKGVSYVNGLPHIDLNSTTYQVQYDAAMRCWNIIDPANPFAFFGKQPVRLNDQGKWQIIKRSHLRGGGLDDPSSYKPLEDGAAEPSTAGISVSDYELPLPQQLQPHLQGIVSRTTFDPTGMGMEWYFEVHYADIRETFRTLRERLYRDANAFFTQPVLRPRPQLPALEASTSIDTLVENIFAKTNGLIISEAPASVASKRLLILNMPLLKEQRVEVLYIEHLFTDTHLRKLAKYKKMGSKTKKAGSDELKRHFRELNNGALDNQTKEYDYYHLIKAAHRHNIEVRPFSSSISYPFADHPIATAAGDHGAAQKISNFFGHRLISGDTAANPSRRWVALLDQKLAHTYREIPGIAELEGAISVRVQDVPSGRAMRITQETGITRLDGSILKSDFKLELSNPLLLEKPPVPSKLDRHLYRQLNENSAISDSNSYTGAHGFGWDETNGWQRVEPENWTADSPPTAIQQSLADATYEMPIESRNTLHELMHFEHKGLKEGYFFDDAQQSAVRQQFFDLRKKLQRDARSIISGDLPTRPTLPAIRPEADTAEFLEQLYQHTDGVVIGESHFSIASKKLLIDNMPLLSQQGVKTLYFEHLLTDLHQADLDRFFETGQMGKTLLHDLRVLDKGHVTDSARIYNFEQLIIKARENGLEVRAIDCAASYRLEGFAQAPTTRQQMMSYFASRTIRKHQQVMGSHKWIALVGNSHSNTYKNIVPGLAELEGGIGVRVADVQPGKARALAYDAGDEIPEQLSIEKVFIKGDYLVEMETLPVMARPPQPLTLEQRLPQRGMFLIEQAEDGQHVIVHRSRDEAIHRTPVMINAEGKVYVERPTWTSVHLEPYEDMDALILALEELNLTRMA